MINSEHNKVIYGIAFSLGVLAFFTLWAEFNSKSLLDACVEDALIENLTATFLGLSCISFIVFAFRSDFLRNHGHKSIYLFTVCWILLLFIFVGEELSWGQRILDISTPESLSKINKQNELNIHNIEFVDSFLGGKYRYLSIFMITTGLILPVFALSKSWKRIIQKYAFPVCPLHYSTLLAGAYVWGKYYKDLGWAGPEVRELLMAIAMFCFAVHGAIKPCILFRNCQPKK
jgi:hypothetical protein